MATLDEQIATAEAAADALKQKKLEQDGMPISKKYVDDVMAGTIAIKPKEMVPDGKGGTKEIGEDPVDCVNMKAKGITTGMDAVDGKWATVTLPTNTAVGDAKALLFAQHAVLTSGPMGGQRIDLNGDTGPIEIRLHHLKLARWIYESEKTFT